MSVFSPETCILCYLDWFSFLDKFHVKMASKSGTLTLIAAVTTLTE